MLLKISLVSAYILLVTVLSLRALLPGRHGERQLPQNPALTWEKLRKRHCSWQSSWTLTGAPKRPLAQSPVAIPRVSRGAPTLRNAHTWPRAPPALLHPAFDATGTRHHGAGPHRPRALLSSTTATVCRPPLRTRLPTAPACPPPPARLAPVRVPSHPRCSCHLVRDVPSCGGIPTPRLPPRRLQPPRQPQPVMLIGGSAVPHQLRRHRPGQHSPRFPDRPQPPPAVQPRLTAAGRGTQRSHCRPPRWPHLRLVVPSCPTPWPTAAGTWGHGHQPQKRQPGLLGQQRYVPDPESSLLTAKGRAQGCTKRKREEC